MSNDDQVKALLQSAEKQFGKGAIRELGGGADAPAHGVISTGSLALNHALGMGGIPKGVVTDIVGTAGVAAMAVQLVAETQRSEGVAAYIDLNHRFDIGFAQQVGVNVDRLLVSQPDNAEQAFAIADVLARSGAVTLIVVDSADALRGKADLEGDPLLDGDRSRPLERALRSLTAIAFRTGVAIVFLRSGNAGSNALKFYSSVRMQVDVVGDVIIDRTLIVGSRVRVRVVKNKFAAPFQEAHFDVRDSGVDAASDLLDFAVDQGVLTMKGPPHEPEFRFAEEWFARGRETAREVIRSGAEIVDRVRAALKQ